MQKYDTESYRWLFAACESIRLWNAHDHFWVEKVRAKGALDSDEVKNFAYIYQTIRSTSEQSRLNVNEFITKNSNLNPKDIYIKSIEEDISFALQGKNKNKKEIIPLTHVRDGGRIGYRLEMTNDRPQAFQRPDLLSPRVLQAVPGR